jgi:predicted metal-dependent peptidase
MKEERKLKRVKITLMRNPKFALWSGIMMVGKTIISDDIPTACTNGRDEIYGLKFIRDLTEKELAFVILHENMHKAFRHLTIWGKLYKENPQLANAACDFVINLLLVEMDPAEQFIAFPKDAQGNRLGLFDKRFKGMHTKQVYDLLKKEQEAGGGGGQGQGQGQGQGFDEHDWEGAQELSDEEKKTLEREIDQALRQGKVAEARAGNSAGNQSRELGELLEPKVDWREVLREFVTSTCSAKDESSWRRPNRRYVANDVYLPSLIGERVGRVAIGIDTSGSIGGPILNKFLSEVKGIMDTVMPERVDLLYWDTHVASHEEYGEGGLPLDSLINSTKPRGGGGTDPTCMIRYLKDNQLKPECIIILTDGDIGNWGSDWPAPVLWVIYNPRRNIQAPNGKTVTLDD